MIAHFNIEIRFFHKFPFQAIACAFAQFQSATRKFGVIISAADIFITHQYLFVFIQ